MGRNYRFRLSDMIPNAWFYKLKDMGNNNNNRKQQSSSSYTFKRKPDTCSTTTMSQRSSISQGRYSYYYNNNSPLLQHPQTPPHSDFPTKSSTRRKTIYKPSPKLVHNSPEYCTSSSSPVESSSESGFFPEYDDDPCSNESDQEHDAASCNCKVTSSTADIIIDMNGESNVDGFDPISELKLPPILTKPAKFNDEMVTEEISSNFNRKSFSVKEGRRKSASNSPGIRLRSNSPRIASRKIQAASAAAAARRRNRILSESFAVVKSSEDPLKDFKDSMVEMILENGIQTSKDLEELLACYLSLNSKEYHDLIVKAFEQIWFDMRTHISL